MHLGSIYLVVRDYGKAIEFYEKLLKMKVSAKNGDRFAQFMFEGHNISIMNGYYDREHPVVHRGEFVLEYDDGVAIAEAENTHKTVLNFWTEDLRKEWERVKELGIGEKVTGIKFVNHVMPYYYFQMMDPDGNVIEVTGEFEEKDGEIE